MTVAGIKSSTICIIVYFTHFFYYIDKQSIFYRRSFSKQGIRKLVTALKVLFKLFVLLWHLKKTV